MNLTLKQLRAFVTVADLQSFSLAAERLSLTPGAVSLLVRDLEAELGFAVFDRTTRRVALSKAGRDYLPAAHQVLRQLQAAVLVAQHVKSRASGIVRVAAPLIVAQAMLPPAIAAYRQQHPDVTVQPVDCAVENLAQMVEDDQTDLSVGPDRPTGDLVERRALYESPWVVWCAPGHPLAARARVTWASLKTETVITAGRDYETMFAPALAATPPSERFAPSLMVEHITSALGLAAAGLGVTVSPMYTGVVARGMDLVARRLEAPAIAREFSLYRPRQRALTPAAEAFAEFLAAFLQAKRLKPDPRRRPAR
jgi:DNA-binding transcriptional LysR family regulator